MTNPSCYTFNVSHTLRFAALIEVTTAVTIRGLFNELGLFLSSSVIIASEKCVEIRYLCDRDESSKVWWMVEGREVRGGAIRVAVKDGREVHDNLFTFHATSKAY